MCTESTTAHDALDEALELSVNTGGGPDQEIVDVESHQQRSTTFDVMETSEEEKTKKYHTTPTEATQNPFFVHPARDWKIITTDTGYQIPTVFYRTNTVFSHKPSNQLPTGRK